MGSKLGFHVQKRRRGWPNVIADTVPALVKSLEWGIVDEWIPEEQSDPIKHQRALKWAEYNVFLLGRHVVTTQYLDKPEDRAHEFWTRILDDLTNGDRSKRRMVLDRMRLFHAWEGFNEIGTGPDIEKLGRFDALMARYFHDEGMKYAGGGFSMTLPTLEEWPRYYGALLEEAASDRGERPDFIHFHEYWFPRGDWDALLDVEGAIDASRMRQATKGYMLHWRDLYEHPDTPAEVKLPVLITECGWDQGWPEQLGFRASNRSDEDYYRWLVWYDQELQKPLNGIDYVVGAAIYTYGHETRWTSFEIDRMQGRGVLDRLRAYLRDCNRAPHTWDWEAAWEGEGQGELVGHYVLLSPESSIGWRQALNRYLAKFQATNGQSLDDALRLAVDRPHRITLVGSPGGEYSVSQEWEDEIVRRHPEIALDRMAAASERELRRIADRRAQRDDRYGQHDDDSRRTRQRLRRE